MCVQSLGLEDAPREGNGKHILAWEIPKTKEPGRLQSLQRVRDDLVTKQQQTMLFFPVLQISVF